MSLAMGFPGSSAGKGAACNAGDPRSIPGSGRSPGERIGYPLQYSWPFLMAQLVKNMPAMRETWVQSLGWEDTLEKGKAIHSSILAWRIPCTVLSMGAQRVRHDWATFTHTHTHTHTHTQNVLDPRHAKISKTRPLSSRCSQWKVEEGLTHKPMIPIHQSLGTPGFTLWCFGLC